MPQPTWAPLPPQEEQHLNMKLDVILGYNVAADREARRRGSNVSAHTAMPAATYSGKQSHTCWQCCCR